MKCTFCINGETKPGKTKSIIEEDGIVVIIRDIPADVCTNCGEAYLDDSTAEKLDEIFDEAVKSGEQVVIKSFETVS